MLVSRSFLIFMGNSLVFHLYYWHGAMRVGKTNRLCVLVNFRSTNELLFVMQSS